MAINLIRVDSAPIRDEDFSPELSRWFPSVVDSVNESFQLLEDTVNTFAAPQYTTVQITAFGLDPNVPNGSIFYDTTSNQLKAKVNNAIQVL